MTFGDLRELFTGYTGVDGDIDDAQLALWFNEAQTDLAYDLGVVTEWVLSADTEKPADCIRIVDATEVYSVSPVGVFHAYRYPVTVYYIKMPTLFTGTDVDQECELPSMVHHLLALFAASRYWDLESEGDGEESGHATKWMNYYMQGKHTAKAYLRPAGNVLDGWRIE